MNDEFVRELASLIDRYNLENESNTPDFILASYLNHCLKVFAETTKNREHWFGVELEPGVERSNSKKEIAVEILKDIEENVHAQIDSLGKAPEVK